MSNPSHTREFGGFREPWTFNDAETVPAVMQRAGFIEVETSMESALTILEGPPQYAEFVRSVILRQIRESESRTAFVAALTGQAAADDRLAKWNISLRRTLPAILRKRYLMETSFSTSSE